VVFPHLYGGGLLVFGSQRPDVAAAWLRDERLHGYSCRVLKILFFSTLFFLFLTQDKKQYDDKARETAKGR
jgi:hypothetical protein